MTMTWLQHPWALESGSMIACFVQFAAMIIVCIFFNGKPVFDGPFITLNTIISILSTGSKASMLTAVASCISQANWSLFAGPPRRLYDFEMVADASRGPLGSLQLLLSSKFRGGAIVRMGAIITVFAIIMDPFAQQLIQLHQAMRSEAGGSFPRAVRYDQGVRFGNYSMEKSVPKLLGIISSPDLVMKAALLFGLTSDRSQILQQASYSCPTSECEYSDVTSAAICSKCANVDSSLKRTTEVRSTSYIGWVGDFIAVAPKPGSWNATRFELPNGLYMQAQDDLPNSMLTTMTTLGTSNASKTITTKDMDTLIWSQSIIKVDNKSATTDLIWPQWDVHATECALYYCVKNYSFQVRNGTLTESSKIMDEYRPNKSSWQPTTTGDSSSQSSPLPENFRTSLAYHPIMSLHERTSLELASNVSNTERFSLSQTAVDGISYLAKTTFSSCRPDKNCSNVVEDRPPPTGFLDPTAHAPEAAELLWRSDNLTTLFENVAMSMSNALRAGDATGTERTVDDSYVRGKVFRPVTLYQIRWPWVSLHAVIQAAAIVFFFLTRFNHPPGGKAPVWKSSELAVFSSGILVSDVLKDSKTLEELNAKAKESLVILAKNDEEHPLMQVPSASERSSIQIITNK
ncbi:unnamed protein product [Clonostachys byssicola]|uniref:Uncharacterized protein n=1 Tax=Clonostachys byssicola TaxID=160290 RepID=A0A9N9UTD2_9HYPO|nr:unnamed protein product [Clonostachys byssicola]